MNSHQQSDKSFPALAPVELATPQADSVSHSLSVLATVYHYNHWIFDTIRKHLGESVVEVGSGIGNITQFLLNLDKVVCLEPFDPYHDYLARRFADHTNVSVFGNEIQDCPNSAVAAGQFDSVICLNVLEHIDDDVDALIRMKQLLRPGGRAIVLVPALQCIYGEMDRAMGHLRRYSLGSLKKTFGKAGLKVRHGRYMNAAGVLAWWWRGRVRKKSTIPVSATKKFDRMVPVLSAIERLIPVLVGQSAVVVGEA